MTLFLFFLLNLFDGTIASLSFFPIKFFNHIYIYIYAKLVSTIYKTYQVQS